MAVQPTPEPNEYPQLEQTTGSYAGVLVDHLGIPVPGSILETLTLTLYCLDTAQSILNGRSAQDVLQVNGVTVGEDGAFLWEIAPADNTILYPVLDYERHRALFEWTWATGTRTGHHEVVLVVKNLSKVP